MDGDSFSASNARSETDSSEWRDVIGSGAVKIRVVRRMDGDEPEYKQIVYIHYQLRLPPSSTQSGATSPIVFDTREYESGEPIKIVIGDMILDSVVPGIMLTARMMRQGEIYEARISHRFGFGAAGEPEFGISPDQDLEARVECIAIGEMSKEPVDMTPDELVANVQELKERGSYFFRRGDLMRAIRCYQTGLKNSESHLPPSPQPGQDMSEIPTENDDYNDNPQIMQLRIDCTGNLAACFEKQDKLKEAKDACTAVIAMQPTNLKALLRASRICTHQGEFEEALACLKTANECFPDDKEVKRQGRLLKQKMEQYRTARKKQFKGVLLNESDDAAVQQSPASTCENIPVEFNPLKSESPSMNGGKTETSPVRLQVDNSRSTSFHQIPFALLILLAPTIAALITFFMGWSY